MYQYLLWKINLIYPGNKTKKKGGGGMHTVTIPACTTCCCPMQIQFHYNHNMPHFYKRKVYHGHPRVSEWWTSCSLGSGAYCRWRTDEVTHSHSFSCMGVRWNPWQKITLMREHPSFKTTFSETLPFLFPCDCINLQPRPISILRALFSSDLFPFIFSCKWPPDKNHPPLF